MSIPDPCGIEYGYQRIVAIWVKYIMVGINYYNKDVLRSNTVRGYALAVNTLFRLRGYEPPYRHVEQEQHAWDRHQQSD